MPLIVYVQKNLLLDHFPLKRSDVFNGAINPSAPSYPTALQFLVSVLKLILGLLVPVQPHTSDRPTRLHRQHRYAVVAEGVDFLHCRRQRPAFEVGELGEPAFFDAEQCAQLTDLKFLCPLM